MRQNAAPTHQYRASNWLELQPSQFLESLTGKTPDWTEIRAELTPLYDKLETIVDDFYGYDGSGRSPSFIDREDATILYAICRMTAPGVIVETGVSDGVSSAIMLEALSQNTRGRLVSLDFPLIGLPRLYGKRPGWAVPQELRSRWTLHFGRSRKSLPRIFEGLRSVDLFFHDSEHSYECMHREFSLALRYLRPDGILLSDDARVSNALADAARSAFGGEAMPGLTPSGLGGFAAQSAARDNSGSARGREL